MTSNIFFPNRLNIMDHRLIELCRKYQKYHDEIDSKTLLNEIDYTLGRDYYDDAKEWLKLFRDAEWWREDLI